MATGRTVEWHDAACRLMRDEMDCGPLPCGTSKSTFYLEMRARLRQGPATFRRDRWHAVLGQSWYALTVLFWDAKELMTRLESVSEKLGSGQTCWVWLGVEPDWSWKGCPTATTCVAVVGGCSPGVKVDAAAGLILDRMSETAFLGDKDLEYGPAWCIESISSYESLFEWVESRKDILRCANRKIEFGQGFETEFDTVLLADALEALRVEEVHDKRRETIRLREQRSVLGELRQGRQPVNAVVRQRVQ